MTDASTGSQPADNPAQEGKIMIQQDSFWLYDHCYIYIYTVKKKKKKKGVILQNYSVRFFLYLKNKTKKKHENIKKITNIDREFVCLW